MRKICLIGGTGFVGKYLANRLVKNGWQVRILTRQREQHRDCLVLPTLELVTTNFSTQDQLNTHLAGCDVVINLVGILNDTGRNNAGFRRAHVELPQKLLTACKINNIQRLLHVSALNANAQQGNSHYLRTKGEGEDLLHSTKELNVTSFRPSVMFGEADSFFNRFAKLLRLPLYVFMLPSASAKFAPVWVEDVVEAMMRTLDEPKHYGQRYNLCGPKVYTLQQLVEYTAQLLGIKRRIVALSDKSSHLAACVMEYLPGKPYSIDNYHSSQVDSVCSDNHLLTALGITPHSIEAIMPRYFTRHASKAVLYSQFRYHARR